ncbi:hypothetical protein M408DRAFT_333987 [Serendipita vermifera MAFF 305830]|uniref:Uncharacterized protein n=1 Tax=Serendipita vermifera MAFF 305830 TaxID=933852 RepID=A0A0C3AMA1_SERVB|nr:hypothetical protein M408DRAFT_333987 [Serendipita vermifera MAFF 305830]
MLEVVSRDERVPSGSWAPHTVLGRVRIVDILEVNNRATSFLYDEGARYSCRGLPGQ